MTNREKALWLLNDLCIGSTCSIGNTTSIELLDGVEMVEKLEQRIRILEDRFIDVIENNNKLEAHIVLSSIESYIINSNGIQRIFTYSGYSKTDKIYNDLIKLLEDNSEMCNLISNRFQDRIDKLLLDIKQHANVYTISNEYYTLKRDIDSLQEEEQYLKIAEALQKTGLSLSIEQIKKTKDIVDKAIDYYLENKTTTINDLD